MATALTYDPEELARNLTPAQLHPSVIRAAEQGFFTILDLMDALPWFRTGADWTAWRVFLKALYGLPMDRSDLEVFRACTGRSEAPQGPAAEAWLAVGRRGRKSAISALIGLWHAAYQMDYGALIAPGETPTVPILSKDKYEAGQIRDYVKAMLSEETMGYLLASKPAGDVVPLLVPAPSGCYRVDIVVRAATITGGRSRTVLAGLLDEVAFFRSDESANPDKEIIRGLKPGMSTIPNALLLGLSSPYARRGVLWEKYQEHWGKPGTVLFWKAPTLKMHDTPQVRQVVREAYDEDAIGASAEYGAEFRTDVEVYVNHEVVNAATAWDRESLAFKPGVTYYGFVDPAGGTGDDFTWAISHWDGSKAILDVLGEQSPPFDPGDVVGEVAQTMQGYGIRRVTGDHWAGEWPTAMFRRCKMAYYISPETKSEIYREMLPVLNSGDCELLDHKKLRQQLVALDRRTARGGRDSIDHPPGAHDDVCLAMGTLVATTKGPRAIETVVAGDYVLAPGGVAQVFWAGQTGTIATISRGTLTATASHPVFCEGLGFEAIVEAKQDLWSQLTLRSLIRWAVRRSLYSGVPPTGSWGPDAITSASQRVMLAGGTRRAFTSRCGRLITAGRFRKAVRFITRTTILSTIALATWSVYRLRYIGSFLETGIARLTSQTFGALTTWVDDNGTEALRALRGIASTLPRLASGAFATPALVYGAAQNSSAGQQQPSFARIGVRPQAEAHDQSGCFAAPSAEWTSARGTSAPRIAQDVASGSIARSNEPQPVYNLRVEGAECFYANGVLVHNCNSAAGALLMAYRANRKPVEVRDEPKTTEEIVMRKIQDSVWKPRQTQPVNPYARKR